MHIVEKVCTSSLHYYYYYYYYYTHTHTHPHTPTHTHTHTHTHTQTFISVCMHVCKLERIHVNVSTYIYLR